MLCTSILSALKCSEGSGEDMFYVNCRCWLLQDLILTARDFLLYLWKTMALQGMCMYFINDMLLKNILPRFPKAHAHNMQF